MTWKTWHGTANACIQLHQGLVFRFKVLLLSNAQQTPLSSLTPNDRPIKRSTNCLNVSSFFHLCICTHLGCADFCFLTICCCCCRTVIDTDLTTTEGKSVEKNYISLWLMERKKQQPTTSVLIIFAWILLTAMHRFSKELQTSCKHFIFGRLIKIRGIQRFGLCNWINTKHNYN